MKIAVDGSILDLPRPTGVERSLREILRALPGALGPGDRVEVLRRCAGSEDDGPVRGIALGGPAPIALWREASLGPALRDRGFDVLWSPVAAIPLGTRVPCVATVHEIPWRVRRGLEGWGREAVHRLRVGLAARRARRIVCPSRDAAGEMAAEHPRAADRLRVVPHAVPGRFADAAPGTAEGSPPPGFLLHVGGTRARKNVPHLLRAYATYRNRGGRTPLVLAGPGDPPAAAEGTTWLGWVDDERLVALYDRARALVVSSESEGFGIPVLEAMARGLPVVAVAAGGVPEAAQGAALLVPPGDPGALAAAVLRVETEPGLAADLAGRGRRRACLVTWEASAAKLRAVLAEAAGS